MVVVEIVGAVCCLLPEIVAEINSNRGHEKCESMNSHWIKAEVGASKKKNTLKWANGRISVQKWNATWKVK